ncbi:Uma2 family endonuclease [Tumidithrix elongata RA019]|uniref:Uma2 family endonuclease n=1 Tax=Tumidithrix elongata BACA0141 TaxID=2716417 RepID=A0AAW9Q7M1_9CYAN|nr:Uma2 family endonuclease [Tumidithrix elongata RA019]
MIAQPQQSHMTPQEYLEWESHQQIRHEYIDGEVFAMAGGTRSHNRIALNLATSLDSYLQNKGCEFYASDVKVQLSKASAYHYPDLVVTCDPRDIEAEDRGNNLFVQYPCLIVEVLSPSTEAYDRGGKFMQYRKLETLQEYVLIQSEQIGVECFRKNSQGLWVLYPYEKGETLTLESIGFSLPVEALYRQVRFDLTESTNQSSERINVT